MKIKDLLESIDYCKKRYGDFDEWEIYLEQVSPSELAQYPQFLLNDGGDESKGEDNWQYFKATGFHSYFEDKKIFTININY